MVKKIGVTVATLTAAGAIGLTGLASAAGGTARAQARAECPEFCLDIYQPVTCKLSNGRVRTFGNRCYAEVYACKHNLTIVSCKPAAD